jgi:hypothetical protein
MALSASATVAPARLSPAIGFPSMHIVALDVLGSGDADHNDVRGYFPTAREQLKDKVPQGGMDPAEIYAVNCSPCHGPRMQGSESAFDLRKFPSDQHERFLNR